MRSFFILIALIFACTACSSDDGSSETNNGSDMGVEDVATYSCECEVAFVTDMGEDVVECDYGPAGAHVPEADFLCQDDDPQTGNGQPDSQGCPNTCSCDCRDGKCYLNNCTLLGGCETCPVFR